MSSNIDNLYECIESKGINHSRSREAIYQVLLKSEECLTVAKISKNLSEIYPKNISVNTIYRNLTLFEKCGLILVLQDNLKRAYYCIAQDDTMFFAICTKCNRVEKISKEEPGMCDELCECEFVTVHKKCQKCR